MLETLFNKYKCDKSTKHGYHKVYDNEFSPIRELPINFLEIGIFRGQSLQAWLDYFPNANFYAIDIFTRLEPKDIPVLKNKRVKWLKADSTKPEVFHSIKSVWKEVKFDIILDDGLHTPRANAQTFTNLKNILKPDGSYYIEDVWPLHIMSEAEKNHWWLKKHRNLYNDEEMEFFMSQIPKDKMIEFDLRKESGHPDSYIIKI